MRERKYIDGQTIIIIIIIFFKELLLLLLLFISLSNRRGHVFIMMATSEENKFWINFVGFARLC